MITSKKLTDKRIAEIEAFEDNTDIDLPEFTSEVLNTIQFAHLENFRITPIKKSVSIRLDADILEALKKSGKGWQTKVNKILRKAVTQDQL